MLKAFLMALAAQPTLPVAVQLATSALPAHLDATEFRSIVVGLQWGGKGLLANESKAFAERNNWQPYELTDMGRKWGEYQAALARDLRSGSGKGQLRVLVVSAVSDSPREVLLWQDTVKRLAATSGDQDDVFHWALFHHDNTTEWWANLKTYTNRRMVDQLEKVVVFNHVGPGCKLQNWNLLPQELTERYDYVWLMDSDLRLDFFRWDVYRAVLTTLNPLVSQPSILPPFGGGQSTVIKYLPLHSPCSEGFPVAMEVPRSEVQAPLLSTKIWPAVRARIRNDLLLGPGKTEWFTDSYWDVIAQKAKDDVGCGQVGPLLVNAAPVWHQSWKTLTKKGAGKCPQWEGGEVNRREVSPDEREEVRAALLSIGCQLTTSPKLFEHLFSEQSHEGERLCGKVKPVWKDRSTQRTEDEALTNDTENRGCRKWIDASAEGTSLPTCFQHVPEFAQGEFAEFAKRGMMTYNDTEHMLGRLQVGMYKGMP